MSCRLRLYVREQVEVFIIFVRSALAFTKTLFRFDEFNSLDPFGHFVPELVLYAQWEKSTISHWRTLFQPTQRTWRCQDTVPGSDRCTGCLLAQSSSLMEAFAFEYGRRRHLFYISLLKAHGSSFPWAA
jgi:hypothetical protein